MIKTPQKTFQQPTASRATAVHGHYDAVNLNLHRPIATTNSKKNVVFKPLTAQLVPKVVECIGISFCHEKKDPFTRALNLTPSQWGVMSQMFVQRAAKKDLSLVAYDETQDRVEGVMVNEDWKEAPPTVYRELEDWRPVRAIFNELHTRFKASRPRIESGKVFHPLYFTCVRPESRNQGIVSQLWEKSVELARAHNYTVMVAEASQPTSEYVLQKLGFREVANVPLQEFRFEGEKPFAKLNPEEYSKLTILERNITSNLFI